MEYNFDQVHNRRRTASFKWDTVGGEDLLPLWVADMDFEAAPCIKEAVLRRAQHGIFGYTHVPDEYYAAISRWYARKYGWVIERRWVTPITAVVPAISCVVDALTMPGNQVLICTPVYNCFFSSIKNMGAQVAESRLVVNPRTGLYEVDWADFEAQCADERTVAFILCNPHNPGGRVWSPDELRRMAVICQRHGVTVVADEIHNGIVMPGHHYTPYATVAAEVGDAPFVACLSPSKSFNTAGLRNAFIVCADDSLRRRIDRAVNIHEACDLNPFGVDAVIAALTPEGEEWLEALVAYIDANRRRLDAFFSELRVAGCAFRSMPLQGTYLSWVDCSELLAKTGMTSQQLADLLLKQAHVQINAGTMYGAAGEGYLRINLACPRAILDEALERIGHCLSEHFARAKSPM